jgi:hypothetical protein
MSTQQLVMSDLFQLGKEHWLDQARSKARDLLEVKPNITIEDVLAECPKPLYLHRNTIGSVFKHDDFMPVGWKVSKRSQSRGRPVRVWVMRKDY